MELGGQTGLEGMQVRYLVPEIQKPVLGKWAFEWCLVPAVGLEPTT